MGLEVHELHRHHAEVTQIIEVVVRARVRALSYALDEQVERTSEGRNMNIVDYIVRSVRRGKACVPVGGRGVVINVPPLLRDAVGSSVESPRQPYRNCPFWIK